MQFRNDNQFKNYMKNQAESLHISPTNAYNTFFSRDLLYRINSISNGDIFVKGSFSEFAHIGKMVRPITDVDIATEKTFEETFPIILDAIKYNPEVNEFHYELRRPPYRTNTGIYKIHLNAVYGKVCHPLSIDFQTECKYIYKGDYKVIRPIFAGDNYYGVSVPTIEEYIAEKLYIILANQREDILNTRVKDFYDIWELLGCDYIPNEVEKYFGLMVVDHGKLDVDNLNTDFINADYIARHSETWDIVKKKYEFLDNSVTFYQAVNAAKAMLNNQILKFYKNRGKAKTRK